MMNLTSMRTTTGKEDPELPVQRRGLHGKIAAKKPLLKDTNKKKRLAWAKKHEQ
jgi:hypothetical protein